MIRVTFLLRKRADLSHDDFYEHWYSHHGPLVAGFGATLRLRRYVQVHALNGDSVAAAAREARGGMEAPYDGAEEMWWDSESALTEVHRSDEGQKMIADLVEDEAKFIDLANSPLWIGHEYPQINPSPENIVARPRNAIVKMYYPLRHIADLTESQAQQYWHRDHGPLIRSQAASGGLLRYVQVHRTPHELETVLRDARGTRIEHYTGHAELWSDRRQNLVPTNQGNSRRSRAIEDERKFIDFERSTIFHAKEHEFIDHTQGD